MFKVAINGLGRIGRATLKIVMESPELELVAVNELASPDQIVYLLRHDSVYGRYDKAVTAADGRLLIDDHALALSSESDPGRLPWNCLHVDLVFECTGAFTRRQDLVKHVAAGARFVILSAPAIDDDVDTIVHGVNTPQAGTALISCASCTTNCITPVIEILDRRLGIRKATMTTLHAYTASQRIVDGPHEHFRRGRAGATNFVPTSTGAAAATTKALSQFRGRFDGVAVRGPVPVGSLADIVVLTARPTTVAEINGLFAEEADTDRYRGVVGVTEDPFVSSDIIRDSRASVVDLGLTQVVDGDLVKVMSWYDNEWGYSNQLVREAQRIASAAGV
ncbi:MAG TPA: glyceraldehyde 3-phosphate dehydrogenase NAD-binding domain-containing protein [Vicinamibacterales bacterium]|nr:glyceraldehyde 3-phosphate dehydrogenase NAD-binding domain-containing protein [Vicinamibacterales bacterium]